MREAISDVRDVGRPAERGAKDRFLDLSPTHNPHRWFLPVEDAVCAGRPGHRFLFGGAALAAAIGAMERTCDRPAIWATAQYLSFARPGATVDLDVRIKASGRAMTQATTSVHIDDREIITVQAALGHSGDDAVDQWIAMPPVPPPGDCSEVKLWRIPRHGLHDRFETRLASGRFAIRPDHIGRGDGRTRFWIRSIEGWKADRMMLAVMADYVSVGIGGAMGDALSGNSLDNTIRFARVMNAEWILCDIHVEAVGGGVVHGSMRLFDEGGVLNATASQSLILRRIDPADFNDTTGTARQHGDARTDDPASR